MAQTEFTGYLAEVIYDGITFEGLLNGTINETGKGAVEQLDVTTNADAAYTFLADPLGPKSPAKATITITLQDSTASYADTKQTTLAFNDPATLVVDMAKGTSTANTYTHTAAELIERVTRIPLDGLAECTLTFEANSLGAWTSP